VSLKGSSVCVVDAAGRIVREAKVASEPEALVEVAPVWWTPRMLLREVSFLWDLYT